MKRFALILFTILCLTFVVGCEKEETIEEDLVKYGTEYAECEYPADDIAWELAGIAQEEFLLYDAELNPKSTEVDPISGFDEELEVSLIHCQPYADFLIEDGMYHTPIHYIRIGWGLETGQLRNVLVSFYDEHIDVESLMYNIFHNSDIDGLGEIYDKLQEVEVVTANGYEMSIIDNVMVLGPQEGYYNIWFLPHNVYVENGTLYYLTGEEVNIDIDWGLF